LPGLQSAGCVVGKALRAHAPVPTMTGCYLLHFDPPFKHAKHYLGWAKKIASRVQKHQAGQSRARLTTAAAQAGVQMTLARTWPGATRIDEARIKRQGGLARSCPLCCAAGLTRDQKYIANKKARSLLARPDAVETLFTEPAPGPCSSSPGACQSQTSDHPVMVQE